MSLQLQTFQGAGLHGLKGLIARSPPSRLLNLNALRKSPPEDPGYLKRPFFLQPILNRAIIVKHNMRRGEESLDGKRQLNALKMLFPLDAANLTFGARALFVSQCDLEPIFQNSFESDPPSTDRDLKLIGLLEEAPTLDPFLLQEIVRQYGFDVSPCYFAQNRQVLRHQTAIVAAEANPILELFGSTALMDPNMSTAPADTHPVHSRNIFTARCVATEGGERDQRLSEYFFNWKALLFYRLRLAELTSATKHLLISLERLRPTVGLRQVTPLTELSRRRVYDALSGALSEAQLIVEDYDMLHYGVLQTARPELFRALLQRSKAYLSALGARIGRLDDGLGFWSAHAPGGPDGVEAYSLQSFMEAFDRHIGSDLLLPKFVKMTPRAGLVDHPSRWTVTSRLRSDLQD